MDKAASRCDVAIFTNLRQMGAAKLTDCRRVLPSGRLPVFHAIFMSFISSVQEDHRDGNKTGMQIIGDCKEIEMGENALGCLCMAAGRNGRKPAVRPAFDKSYPLFRRGDHIDCSRRLTF
jgi:hypothetical protein